MTFNYFPILLSILTLCGMTANLHASEGSVNNQFSPGKLSFDLYINEVPNSYAIMAVFGLPNERITFQVKNQFRQNRISLVQNNVEIQPVKAGLWQYTMPNESGSHSLVLKHKETNEVMQLNLFVLHDVSELNENYYLHGYQVGKYPQDPLYGLASYLPPKGFVKVTADLLDVKVSPHFLLRQFLCKQESGFPKFLVLDQKIIFKLEKVLAEVNKHGIHADTFTVMSAYRTPSYNTAIGQGKYSRHQWGDAVDIFIDVSPKDGVMDDINQDGVVNQADAAYLYTLIDQKGFKTSANILAGGLGDYKANKIRGPFVHMDTRGYLARWGNSAR